MEEERKESFRDYIKKIESEETRLLKLQKRYRNGEIRESELTGAQIIALCELYDKQIEELQKSNENRRKRILKYTQKER